MMNNQNVAHSADMGCRKHRRMFNDVRDQAIQSSFLDSCRWSTVRKPRTRSAAYGETTGGYLITHYGWTGLHQYRSECWLRRVEHEVQVVMSRNQRVVDGIHRRGAIARVLVLCLLLAGCSTTTHSVAIDATDVTSVELFIYEYGASDPVVKRTVITDPAVVGELVKAYTDVPGKSIPVVPDAAHGDEAVDVRFNVDSGESVNLTAISLAPEDTVIVWSDSTVQQTDWGVPYGDFVRPTRRHDRLSMQRMSALAARRYSFTPSGEPRPEPRSRRCCDSARDP